MLDPDLSQPINNELQAVEVGYAGLRQEIAEYLGPFSVGQSLIEQRQQEIERLSSNREFLTEFGKALPSATEIPWRNVRSTDSYNFSFHDGDIQTKVRLVQSHVLWLEHAAVTGGWISPRPYYIVGRRQVEVEEGPGVEELLLLGASPSDSYKLISLGVLREDMQSRDALAERLEVRDLTEEEVAASLNLNGTYILDEKAKGNIHTSNYPYRKREKLESLEYVERLGVRYPRQKGFELRNYQNGIPESVLLGFNADELLAKLAFDFGQEDRLRELTGSNTAKEEKPDLTYEQLLEQNQQLRLLVKNTMLAMGLMSEGEINDLIEKHYPVTGSKAEETVE